VVEVPANKKRIYSLAWNNHGTRLISGSQDPVIKMYTMEGAGLSKVADYKGHSDSVDSLVFYPLNDSVFVSTSVDKTIRLWDAK